MTDWAPPKESVEAARVAWLESASDYKRLDESIATALKAGIEAWPGMISGKSLFDGEPMIFLPLTENTNERE